jgi:hypothetical protein
MSEPDLFGYPDDGPRRRREGRREGRRLRDESMARVDAAANEAWKRQMRIYLNEVCATKLLFTSDDVFDLAVEKGLPAETHDRRAFGPIIMTASKEGLCVKENCPARNSNRASRHAAPLTVWRSLIFGKAQ